MSEYQTSIKDIKFVVVLDDMGCVVDVTLRPAGTVTVELRDGHATHHVCSGTWGPEGMLLHRKVGEVHAGRRMSAVDHLRILNECGELVDRMRLRPGQTVPPAGFRVLVP